MEAQFNLCGITVDIIYDHVVVALDSPTNYCIMGLLKDPPDAGKYAALKSELLCWFWLSDAERA